MRLRPDLYDDLEPFQGSGAARHAELARAKALAGCGFVAHCDGVSYGREGGFWEEWDSRRLARAGAHVDAAAQELFESAFEPLDAGVLRPAAARRAWLLGRPTTSTPTTRPPAYGRFSHVGIDALELRVARLGAATSAADAC